MAFYLLNPMTNVLRRHTSFVLIRSFPRLGICQNKIFKSENDTHEFVAYFEKEMETKDDVISKLNDELIRKEVILRLCYLVYDECCADCGGTIHEFLSTTCRRTSAR